MTMRLSKNLTVEVAYPSKGINFRSWFKNRGGTKVHGWGIVLSLAEFDTLWKWRDEWTRVLMGKESVEMT